jgi:glycosyltransferase involved in cell wall biosynthesis
MSNSVAKLAVLMPNFNNEPYLKECLESLVNQTFSDFVIIVVDDCSTDKSVEIIKSFQDARIQLYQKEQQTGIVDALNLGLSKITSPYFIRMDGDDISAPDRFEKLINFLETNPDFDICGSSIQTFGSRNDLQNYEQNPLMNKANLVFNHSVGHASCLFRTSLFTTNQITYLDGFWRLEDYFLFYRLKNLGNATSLNQPLYFYRQGEYNNNAAIEEKKLDAYRKIYALILTDLGIEVSENRLNIHVQLAKKSTPQANYAAYFEHAHLILKANQSRQVYPQNELKIVINSALKRVLFKLIDAQNIGFFELLKASKFDLKLVRYYVSMKRKRGSSEEIV